METRERSRAVIGGREQRGVSLVREEFHFPRFGQMEEEAARKRKMSREPQAASFLSGNQREQIHHDCLETTEAPYSSHSDLKDTPLDDEETWFTNGSSYIINGKRHAGCAVSTSRDLIESGPLPAGWPEALPTRTAKAQEETKVLLHEMNMGRKSG